MKDKKNNIFEDLEARGIVEKFNKGLGTDDIQFDKKMAYHVSKYKLQDGKSFFVKDSDNQTSVASVASSKLCSEAGILTPPVYALADKKKKTIKTLQQNVEEIDDFETMLANDDIEYTKIQSKLFGKFKWQMFYDEELIANFLKFMTPNCLTQFQNMFLVDELRTDVDRHTKNYFFYKTKDSKKYQGVIAIDLDLLVIYNYCGVNKEDFTNFLVFPYQTALPHQLYDKVCYSQRMSDMRQLLQDGVLSEANLKAMMSALEFDFPKEMKKVCKTGKLGMRERNEIVSPIERLWEYNQKTIGKDLGL